MVPAYQITHVIIPQRDETRTAEKAKKATPKILTLSEFLAISLVRLPTMDVVAVAVHQIGNETVKVTICGKESTSDDYD